MNVCVVITLCVFCLQMKVRGPGLEKITIRWSRTAMSLDHKDVSFRWRASDPNLAREDISLRVTLGIALEQSLTLAAVCLQLLRAGSCLWPAFTRRRRKKTSTTNSPSLARSRTCTSIWTDGRVTSRQVHLHSRCHVYKVIQTVEIKVLNFCIFIILRNRWKCCRSCCYCIISIYEPIRFQYAVFRPFPRVVCVRLFSESSQSIENIYPDCFHAVSNAV